jgi:hypothetical protein
MITTSARRLPTSTMSRVAVGVLTALVLAITAAACSGGGADTTASESAGGSSGDFIGGSEGGRDGGGDTDGVNRAAVQTRAVIKTGQVAVTSDDLDEVRAEVDRLLFGFGGSIDSEQTSHDDEGDIERSTLVLRVPVAEFDPAMDALEKLGKVKTSDSRSKNVTTEVIDVNERVETIQNSLDRLQRFQRQADDIDDLIRFEDQITERESELRSLQAQQAYLADQTSMSTITLYLSTPEKYVPPPDALEDAGFLAGLRGGWNALKDFVVVGLTVVGAVIPFAVAAALVGVPTLLLVRALARRRPGRDAVSEPPAAEPPATV